MPCNGVCKQPEIESIKSYEKTNPREGMLLPQQYTNTDKEFYSKPVWNSSSLILGVDQMVVIGVYFENDPVPTR